MIGGLQPGDPQLIGPYRLVGQLGSGGMGRVFMGLSAGGRPVAVKVIRPELAADQEFRVRFSREVAAAGRVSGLFTALVVDADVDGPVPWLATAYVAGPSLSEAVTRYGPMPVGSVLALAAGLAEGLSAIHAAGVVHCDLKPSNVLLSQDGPRVIDFGISRAAEAASAAAGLVVGSPGFMSPEQAMGEEIGPPSDIFSLGAVLTFAATGGGPFGKGSSPELAYRLVYRPPDLGLLPAELRPLVERCLAKDPGQRPTAEEVLAAAGASQSATGSLPDAALGAFGPHIAPTPRQPARPALPVSRARTVWRPLVAAGVTAAVLGASVAVSFALSGNARPSSAAQLVPRAAVPRTSTAAPPAPVISRARPAAPSSAVPGPRPAFIPAANTVTSPAAATARPTVRARVRPRLRRRPRLGRRPRRRHRPRLRRPPPPRRRARLRPPRRPRRCRRLRVRGHTSKASGSTLTSSTPTQAKTPRASASWAWLAPAGWRKPIPSPAPVPASSGRIASPTRSTWNAAPLRSILAKSRSGSTTAPSPAASRSSSGWPVPPGAAPRSDTAATDP